MKSKTTVLIVEDEAVIAMNLKLKLENMGFKVTAVVNNGADALRLASETPPDLVMMDIIIQGEFDGIETARKLREQQDVPVIFLTAHSDDSTVQRAKAALPYGYLIKPFEEQELRTTIEMALYRHNTESLQRLQHHTINSATSAIVIADALDPDWPILLHNPAFEAFTELSKEDLIGQSLMSFFPQADNSNANQKIRNLLKNGTPDHVTIRFVPQSGEEHWADALVNSVRDNAGRITHHLVILQDVTQRVNAERLARRSQRLEAIGTLAGGVAHDLNNALAPIMMCSELLKIRYPKESETVEMIQNSAQRGADMVRQLLTFAKGAEGERVSTQPVHLIKEIDKLMKSSFPKNIDLEIDWDQKLPTVEGDATQLHQVLLNLCVNARDAMPSGGTLSLEARQVDIDPAFSSSIPDSRPGKFVMLRVKDTGSGIKPEIIDQIFDPFFTTKAPEEGSGLGLPTVLGIIKGHDGFLQVNSLPGRGSSFSAYIPAGGARASTEPSKPEGPAFRGQGELILFVDDENSVREVARAVLRHLNFKTLVATDGADGLIQAAERRAELRAIITDEHMPYMDGLQFARAIRRILPDIPILLTSGRIDETMAEEFEELGITTRLEKPFTEGELAAALEKLLSP